MKALLVFGSVFALLFPAFAFGIGLEAAAQRACINYKCGPECQRDHILYSAAEKEWVNTYRLAGGATLVLKKSSGKLEGLQRG